MEQKHPIMAGLFLFGVIGGGGMLAESAIKTARFGEHHKEKSVVLADVTLAINMARNGNYEGAEKALKKALREVQNSEPSTEAMVRFNLAVLYQVQDKFEQAAPQLAKVTELMPKDWEAWLQRAAVSVKLKNYDDAVAALEKIPTGSGPSLRDDPRFVDLATHPKFKELWARHPPRD